MSGQEGAEFGVLVIGDGPARPEFERKLGDAALVGQFVDVEITEVCTNSLRGRLIPAAEKRCA